MTFHRRVLALFIVLILLSGCGKKAAETSQTSTENQPPAASAPPPSAEPAPAPNPEPQAEPTPAPTKSKSQLKQTAPKQAEAMAPAAPAKVEPPPPPRPVVIPAGTSVVVQLAEPISTKTAEEGTAFGASMAQPVALGGKTVIPSGSKAQGVVVESKSPGKFKGEGVLTVKLTKITVAGVTYPVTASPLTVTQKGKGGRTAKFVGGSAAGGALIGGIAGGGKGAAIGGLVGAGAGTAGAAFTGNKDLEFPAEKALTFKLAQPITLKPQLAGAPPNQGTEAQR
jgi:hypothetical protein